VTQVFPPVPSCRPFTEPYDRAELIADAVMHLVGLCFAIGGMILLTARAGELPMLRAPDDCDQPLRLIATGDSD
jgi:hypothetical protein